MSRPTILNRGSEDLSWSLAPGINRRCSHRWTGDSIAAPADRRACGVSRQYRRARTAALDARSVESVDDRNFDRRIIRVVVGVYKLIRLAEPPRHFC